MKIRTGMLALTFGLAMSSTAFADTLTATVTAWDPQTRTIKFEDRSMIVIDPSIITPDIEPGTKVTVTFESGEDGVDKVNAIAVETN